MKVPIFVSRPTCHISAQEDFIAELFDELRRRGFNPLTLGPGSSYDYEAPLAGMRRLLMHCCGLVSIAFRRTYMPTAIKYAQSDISDMPEQSINDAWLTSPYCQIEPAMAFQLGLPILLMRQTGVVAEGILEKGVIGTYLPEFVLGSAEPFVSGEECQSLLDQWGRRAQTVYDRRGEPQKLYG